MNLIFGSALFAQTTEFTYQGQLQAASVAASGNYDFEFLLFDSGGSQVGSTITRSGVAVAGGIFSVNLDFGSSFPGATRFLEIHVRQAGGGGFTTLSPRQPVTSSPYAVKSLTADSAVNATNATTATTATSFSGSLAGDVTGTQNATTLARLQGRNVANTAPLNDQVLKFNTTANQWLPGTDNTGAGGGGTITGVTAGTGLTGGGTTGTVMVGIAPAGVGTNEIANTSVTDAKIAAATITAPKIATGQVVKSINTLTDNVTLAAGANVTITPTGNTLTIASTSGGVGGSGTTNSIPLWSGGTTIGNSLVSQTGGTTVQLPGFVSLAATASGNNVTFGTPNSETGMTISGAVGRADVRFDGTTLKLVAGPPASGPPSAANGISISTSGRVQIGDANGVPYVTKVQVNAIGITGLTAVSDNAAALVGISQGNTGVRGSSDIAFGVFGTSASGVGVSGNTDSGFGVIGISSSGSGVRAIGDNLGSTALRTTGTSWFSGDTTPLSNTDPGTGIGIGTSGSFGYIFSYDYSASATRTLALNHPGGRVGIGTITPDQALSVNGNASKSGGGSWLAFSDERLKNIKGRFTPGLAAVMRLQPLRYQYKPDNAMGLRADGEYIGFGAKAVEKIIPEAVTKNDHGYRLVNNDPIMWTMLNAIKEQQAMIKSQQRQINQQRNQIRGLTRAINSRAKTRK